MPSRRRNPLLVVAALAGGLTLSGCLEAFLALEEDINTPHPNHMETGPGYTIDTYPDGTTVFSGMHCDGSGGYRGGGDQASESCTKDALEKSIDDYKNQMRDLDRKRDKCGGRYPKSFDYDRRANCDRGRYEQILHASSRPPRNDDEFNTLNRDCAAASNAEHADPCSEANNFNDKQNRDYIQKNLAEKQAELKRLQACIDDRKRQAQANQPQRPGIDPSFILNNPGLFQPRPRQQQQHPQSRPSTGH